VLSGGDHLILGYIMGIRSGKQRVMESGTGAVAGIGVNQQGEAK
jgi:hypothetical protein